MDKKTIIITGAGSGVGRSTAQLFLSEGWHVGLIGRREKHLKETALASKNALILPCDITNEEGVNGAFDSAMKTWGHLDTLFNNAGVTMRGAPIDELNIYQWRKLIDINLTGSFICARKAFSIMRSQSPQGGRIINNGSVSAHVPRWGASAYTASKHAITGLTKTISLYGLPFSIACGQIDIGNALTDLTQNMETGRPQADGHMAPEPVMDVDNVANSVLHMASLPLEANVQFMTVMATNMPYIGRG